MKKKLINCVQHGKTTGYAICLCIVEQGKPVRVVIEPDPKSTTIARTIGSIVCGREANDHGVEELVLVCKRCAEERGFTKVAAHDA